MNIENIIKGILTTILGVVIMSTAYYSWYIDQMTNWQAGGAGLIGFALLWMRDEIPSFIKEFVKVVIEKFQRK